MPRKKSIRSSAKAFVSDVDDISLYLSGACAGLSKLHVSWCYDHAVIRLYRLFETLMLDCLVGALNNDTSTLSTKTGFEFPKHLTDEVCTYLVTGNGYFDFRGRDDLIRKLKSYLPDSHYLIDAVKKPKYKTHIEQLCGLRNFAAHKSDVAKRAALKTVSVKRLRSAGSYLKVGTRFDTLAGALKKLAADIETTAPF